MTFGRGEEVWSPVMAPSKGLFSSFKYSIFRGGDIYSVRTNGTGCVLLLANDSVAPVL